MNYYLGLMVRGESAVAVQSAELQGTVPKLVPKTTTMRYHQLGESVLVLYMNIHNTHAVLNLPESGRTSIVLEAAQVLQTLVQIHTYVYYYFLFVSVFSPYIAVYVHTPRRYLCI